MLNFVLFCFVVIVNMTKYFTNLLYKIDFYSLFSLTVCMRRRLHHHCSRSFSQHPPTRSTTRDLLRGRLSCFLYSGHPYGNQCKYQQTKNSLSYFLFLTFVFEFIDPYSIFMLSFCCKNVISFQCFVFQLSNKESSLYPLRLGWDVHLSTL